MLLNTALTYNYSNNEAVRKSEEILKFELGELVKEIEVNELVHGIGFNRPFTSILATKNDAQILANERKYYIERLLNVHDVHPLYIQADVMREQVEASSQSEYSTPSQQQLSPLSSLSLLLHQFYLDRISHCVQAKHAHLLRWRRFAEHSSSIEDAYSSFKSRLAYIMSEYSDSCARSSRLSQSRDFLLSMSVSASTTTSSSSNVVTMAATALPEDVEIYLRWLIAHTYALKGFLNAMKLIEWSGYMMSIDARASSVSAATNEDFVDDDFDNSLRKSILINPEDSSPLGQSTTNMNMRSSNLEANTVGSILNTRFKKSENVFLSSTNPHLPRNETINSISFLFNQDKIPMHNNSIEFLRPRLRYFISTYKIDYNLSRMQTAGDEMELFAAVNRKFRHLFNQQEHMKKFRVYDILEVGTENWGADSPIHALKKEANWLEFIQIVPMKDYIYEREMAKIRFKSVLDEFILPHKSFLEISDYERVQEILRENSTLIRNPPAIKPVKTGFGPNGQPSEFNTHTLWKKIFQSTSPSQKEDDLVLRDQSSTSSANRGISFRSRSNRNQDEFNFTENLQKLGLDDSNSSDQNLSNVQGSYLSFLMLRHLRIRDLKRVALSYLNYFRSVEKTLTIFDGGLSAEAKNFKRQSPQNHVKETPYGSNLGYHAYLFNNPKDFKISETEFMEYEEIENHDDYYTLDEETGQIHVQDQRGYYIVYDVALTDLKKLERELLQVGTYYIAKDREMVKLQSSLDMRRRKTAESSGDLLDINLGEYSHQNVDRFAVLLDLWTNEVNFLEMKKLLFDIYFEAYQNVFDKAERRKIAQIMTNTMYRRVRYDLSSEYFTSSYRNEVNCLYKQSQITKIILERMIDDMRTLSDKLDGDRKFGMPYSVIKKNLIFLTPNSIGSTLKNMYLLEFHPCLAAVSRLPSALDRCIEELAYFMQANTVNERIRIELSYYNRIITKLQCLDPPGSSFTPHIQKEIFSGVFIEDPQLITDFVESNLKQFEEANKNKSKKEQTEFLFTFMAKLLEIITLRHRLLEAAMETEQLAIVYRKLATEMGFEEYHMYMRYVQLDFAKRKEDAGQPPPLFVSDIGPDDIQIDRYIPSQLCLAINELDESQIGKFSFRGKEALAQILKPGGVENLQLILKLQLSHNNALIAAILQSHSCLLNLSPGSQTAGSIQTIDSSQAKISESKVKFEERLNSTNVFSQMSMNSSVNANSSTKPIATFKFKQYADAFVSIQLEKNPYRDLMLNEYLEQKEKKSSILLTSPAESEKLKRSLMNTFADRFCIKVRQYSLRAQLIAIYNSITRLLDNFPNTRANHFVFGEPNERRQYLSLMSEQLIDKGDDNLAAKKEDDNHIRPDARIFKSRPRKLLSDDGERVLNIWFIPHYTDLLTVFKKSSDEMALRALLLSVRIMGALNDCLQFMLANAVMTVTLGKASATGKLDLSSWENAGGLDSELNDIQLEINQLDSMGTSPEQVATLLEAKRTNMFSQYECAVRFAVRDIFLASGKVDSFKTVSDNIHFALKFLNDYSMDSHNSVYFDLPEILDARDSVSKELFPWRTSISKNGPFPLKYWPWYLIEPNVSLCLQGLNDIDKNTANGEILGITLLMEDVLNLNPDEKTPPPPPNAEPAKPDLKYLATRRMTRASVISLASNRNRASSVMSNNSTKVTATITTNNGGATLLQNYAKWHHFLITWKRCELLKVDWGRRKLGVESINTHYLYDKYCDTYKKEVLLPVFKILVKNTHLKETYENFIDFNQPIVLPNQISELESKSKQIVRLLEKLELSMIDESLQRVQKDLKQVLAERGREESTLATDLWKKPIMKEEFTVNKPHIVSEFTQMLFKSLEKTTNSNSSESSTDSSKTYYVVDEESLKECLIRLGCLVQERERSNFEQYTLFYETLLRQQHQLLYNRERECRSLKSLLDQKCDEINAEVECQMADTCYDLIMEVTALRARLQQIEMSREAIEKELRDKVKGEFIDLVQDLVSVNAKLKAQLDYFKETIYGDVLALLQSSRQEAFMKIIILKNKFHLAMDDLVKEEITSRNELISRLEKSNTNAAKLLISYKVFYKLKMNRLQSNLSRRLAEVTDKMDWHKRREVSHRVANELQNVLVVQQNTALKRQLAKLDAEFNSLKAQLDKELKEKEAKEHVLQQRLKKEKNLESAKRSNVEKLLQELEIKDTELQNLQELADKAAKLSIQESTKTQRELSNLRKSLVQERHLKLDAFHLVDDLQGQIYDLETLENMNFKSSQSELSKNEGSTKNLTISQSLASTRMSSLPYSRLYYEKKQSGARPKTTIGRQRESNKPKETVSTEIYQETVTRIRDVRLKSAKQ